MCNQRFLFICCLGIFQLMFTNLYGQMDFGRALNRPGVYLDAYFAPSASVTDPQNDAQRGDIGYQMYRLSLDFNLLHHEKPQKNELTHISSEFSFRYQHFSLDENFQTQLPEQVFGLDYMLVATHSFNSRWSAIGMGMLGIFSDFEQLSGEDFLLSGGLFAIYSVSSSLQIGLGPELTYVFGKPMLVPAAYINWYIGNKLLLDIQAPSHAILHYSASSLIHFKLAGRLGVGTQYHVSTDTTEEDLYLRFAEGTLGFETEFQLFKHLVLEVDLAYALYRKLSLSEDRGFSQTIPVIQQFDLKSVFLPALRLEWNL